MFFTKNKFIKLVNIGIVVNKKDLIAVTTEGSISIEVLYSTGTLKTKINFETKEQRDEIFALISKQLIEDK